MVLVISYGSVFCFCLLKALKHSLPGFLDTAYSHISLTANENSNRIVVSVDRAAECRFEVIMCYGLSLLGSCFRGGNVVKAT